MTKIIADGIRGRHDRGTIHTSRVAAAMRLLVGLVPPWKVRRAMWSARLPWVHSKKDSRAHRPAGNGSLMSDEPDDLDLREIELYPELSDVQDLIRELRRKRAKLIDASAENSLLEDQLIAQLERKEVLEGLIRELRERLARHE